MNSLAAYGEKDIVITSESITEEAQSLEVTSLGPVKTYTCTGPVTVVNTYEPTAEEPYSFFGVQPLHYNSTSGEYFICDDDGYLDDGFTCTLTEPGLYAVSYIARSADVGEMVALRVVAGSSGDSASPAELRWDSLVAYGGKELVFKAESITQDTKAIKVVPGGSLKPYTCMGPVTMETNFTATAADPYPNYVVLKLNYDSSYGAYFPMTDNVVASGETDASGCTLTEAGFYLVTYMTPDEKAVDMMVLNVVSDEEVPVAPGLLNFKKVNSYKAGMYTDMYTLHTFTENVRAGYEFGIMQGYGTRFGINDNITRLASIIIACRLNCIYYDGSNHIDTTYSGTTQERYLAYAKDHGILCDFADVSRNATRDEFAAILSSAFPDEALPGINTVVDDAIPDVTMDMDYAAGIYRLYRAGILNGSDANGTFYPDTYITRGAACAIATRMCDVSLRKSVSLIVGRVDRLKNLVRNIAQKMIAGNEEMDAAVRSAAALFEHGGTSSQVLATHQAWQRGVEYYRSAASLCGNYPELSEVKRLLNEVLTHLEKADKSGYDVIESKFWSLAYHAMWDTVDLRYDIGVIFDNILSGNF